MWDIREEIDSQVEWYRATMPADIRDAINNLNNDLYNGPLYVDESGERCSCFDEGAKAFPFTSTLDKVRDYMDEINDIEVDVDYNAETDEFIYGRVDGSARAIIKALCGKKLAAML